MKQSIDATILQLKLDVEGALANAQDEIESAKLQAVLKLNDVVKNLDQIHAQKSYKATDSQISVLASIFLWSILTASITGLVAHAMTLDLSVAAEMSEPYAFYTSMAAFTSALLYPFAAFFFTTAKSRGVPYKKVVLVDQGCQTIPDDALKTDHVIVPHLNHESKEEEQTIQSDISLDPGSDEDGEVVHFRAYVEPMRLVDGKWKKYGSLRLNLSSIGDKPCMVFRNDIGVLHMNLPIAKGMTFNTVKDTSNNCYIRFASIEDEVRGLESFMLKVSPAMLDKIHAKLLAMASG
jgi:hypothetical protein